MAHHIYHTQGFVLSSRSQGEANKMVTMYTRELGLVSAVAQGIRLEKSKLRFALQDYSLARIDLVRGRDIWRVTSASHISNFPFTRANRESVLLIARIGKLLERLAPGEHPHEKIFDDIVESLQPLDDGTISADAREALELYIVLRIVHELGYVGDNAIVEEHLGGKFDPNQVQSLLQKRQSIIFAINQAFRESHL